MFERFTDRARRAVVLAQEESRSFGHDYIGTEHLLLGLISEGEGIAAQTLVTDAGLTLDVVRDEVDQRIGRSERPVQGHIPFTPRAKKVLELALRQALKLGHDYIGTEHVLLGLLAEGQGVAVQILLAKVPDGDLDVIENAVMARLVEAGSVSKGSEFQRQMRGRMMQQAVGRARFEQDDELARRLEAIEARLSVIETLLREQRGEAAG